MNKCLCLVVTKVVTEPEVAEFLVRLSYLRSCRFRIVTML